MIGRMSRVEAEIMFSIFGRNLVVTRPGPISIKPDISFVLGAQKIFIKYIQPLHSLCQDMFVKRCKRKVEAISQQDLWVDGAFMSEADMAEANINQFLDSKKVL